MAEPLRQPAPAKPSPTDSPWLWMMIFCAFGLVMLLVAWPKYSQRQSRLELKYRAEQEIARREGLSDAELPAARQAAEAPPEGLIIPLWPVALLVAVLLVVSGAMFWRGQQSSREPAPPTGSRAPPAGGAL
ncbi:MAG: hypothetical protein AB7O59_05990 [Pirellulales bacterium]